MANLLKSTTQLFKSNKNKQEFQRLHPDSEQQDLVKTVAKPGESVVNHSHGTQMQSVIDDVQKWQSNYEAVYHLATTGYFTIYEDTAIKEVNKAAAKMLNVNRLDLLGQELINYIAEKSRNRFFLYIQRVYQGVDETIEIKCIREQGEFDVLLKANLICDEDSGTNTLLCSVMDISSLKEKEIKIEELSESSQVSKTQQKQLSEENERLQKEMIEIRNREKQLITESKRLEQSLNETTSEIETLNREVEKFNSEKESLTEPLQKQIDYFRDLAKTKSEQFAEVKEKLEKIELERKTAEEHLLQEKSKQADLVDEHRSEKQKLKQDLVDQKAFYEQLIEEKKTEVRIINEKLQSRIDENKKSQETFDHERQKLEKSIRDNNDELKRLNSRIEQAQNERKQAEKELKDQIDHFRNIAKQQREELTRADQKYKDQVSEGKKIEADLKVEKLRLEKQLKEKMTALDEVSQKLNRLEQRNTKAADEFRNEKTKLEEIIREYRSDLDMMNIKSRQQQEEAAKLEAELKAERDHYRSLVKDQTQELERLNTRLQQQAEESKALEEELKSKRDYLMGSVKNQNEELQNLKESLAHETSEREKLLKLLEKERKEAQDVIDELYGLVRAEKYEMSHVLDMVSKHMRRPLVNLNKLSSELDENFNRLCTTLGSEQLGDEIRNQLEKDRIFESSELFDEMRSSISTVNLLLDGLLKVSKVHKQTLHFERLDINRLLDKVLDNYRNEIHDYGIDVHVDDLPCCVGDEKRLTALFEHLIDNAIKYGQSRDPYIHIFGEETDGQILYQIEDNGRGMGQEDVDKAFAMFGRLEPNLCPGEGLGLPIVKRIAAQHGGSVKMETQRGSGCKVTIVIPNE